jgi:acetyl-CoA acetyltransferase
MEAHGRRAVSDAASTAVAASTAATAAPSGEVAILGVGMHPWGKWGRNFVEYGLKAARDALQDAGIAWRDVQFISGGATMRCGYPGYVAGATFAQALGWQGAEVNTSFAACASGSQALAAARAKILSGQAEVALVVGADTTPKGFLAPAKGYRPEDPDWVRFHLGITNPTYFALYARRRMALYGATEQDFAQVKVKNAEHGLSNPNARYRKKFTLEEVLGSAMVADPLRLFQICATSDGGAAVVIASLDYARRRTRHAVRIAGISTVTPRFASAEVEMPDIATDSAAAVAAHSFRASIAKKAYEEAGVGPEDVSLAEVYDLASSMELDWMEYLGLCKAGEAEHLLRSGATRIGGRIPVNASGGLACFGEAVPAQALAQVCELTWQLRGSAGARQVHGAKVGISANQGLFGHGSAVILKR